MAVITPDRSAALTAKGPGDRRRVQLGDRSGPHRKGVRRAVTNLHRFDEDGGRTTRPRVRRLDSPVRQNGLAVEDLIELQAPEGAVTTYDDDVAEWARRWPAAAIWVTSRS
jgi:hypothetical protein